MRQVIKFGGASLKDPEALKRLPQLLSEHRSDELVIVVSAMGKTTNALQLLAEHAVAGDSPSTLAQFERIRDFHYEIVRLVFRSTNENVVLLLKPLFTELWQILEGLRLLREFPPRTYDRVMAFGELLSSIIVHNYLLHEGIELVWLDARKLITTDSSFGNASVIWRATTEKVTDTLLPLLQDSKWVITQGYIAQTEDGQTTTLGREGSDYTAAILANLIHADRMVVWKDVPAVMSADPRFDPDAALPIAELSYRQAVTMTYYGASVIHPKTLRPLENVGIPLKVRSFLSPELPGTHIGHFELEPILPRSVLVRKQGQVVIRLNPQDFDFMDAAHLRHVMQSAESKLAISLIHTTAQELFLCVNDHPDAIQHFLGEVADRFNYERLEGCQLVSLLWHQLEPPSDLMAVALIYQRADKHHHFVLQHG